MHPCVPGYSWFITAKISDVMESGCHRSNVKQRTTIPRWYGCVKWIEWANQMSSPRLNVFQRLVRQWDTVHPYNAAQVLRIRAVPDPLAIRRAWQRALASLGIGPVRVTGQCYRYEAVNGNAERFDVPVLAAGTCLHAHLSNEMNRAFGPEELPLRPFMLPLEDGSYYFGVVYHHWIADSASIRLVLREWFARAHDPAAAGDEPALIPLTGYWANFGPPKSRWRLSSQVLSLFRSASQFRGVRKLKTQNSADFDMRFLVRRLPAGTLPRLLAVARGNGVTVNDLFLAAIADVCNRFTPVRNIPRRKDLAIGTIVDLRARAKRDMSRVFGLFLGFANVICRREDLKNWPRLVREIAKQTRIHKESDTAQASSMWMFAALTAARFVPVQKTFRFYRKHMPLAGGISNVNLNTTWAAKYHPGLLLEYIRVSPTGPMVPLVFTPTTLGDDLLFGLTYRASLFTGDLPEKIAATFQLRLEQIAECGEGLLS